MLRAVKNTPAVLLANGLSGHYPYENIFSAQRAGEDYCVNPFVCMHVRVDQMALRRRYRIAKSR